MTVHSDMMAALDGEWRSAAEIHGKIGMWSKTSVRHQLRLLAIAGDVEVKREHTYSGEIALFRAKS